MATMKLIIFNVEYGQCAYIRTPADYGILIDCGRSRAGETASPVEWLAENEASSLKRVGDNALAMMVVTHPREGSVEDINALLQRIPPAVLWCDADYDWDAVIQASEHSNRNLQSYRSWLSNIEPNAEPDPGLDVTVQCFSLDEDEAKALSDDMQDLIDNRSIVTVVTYNSPEDYTWKVVISGDNTASGWRALLTKPDFVQEVKGADFFVTSRHGDESGFFGEVFKATGKPIGIISSTRGTEEADRRYEKQAQGVKFPDGTRRHFVTKDDGNITVEMHDDGRYDVWLYQP